jgi:3-hydroxyisobutyrate dehydrogenase-like beta-hydroxyacid dehydrogenase
MRIGFLGLGNMGAPIAHNLLKAGHELIVWNRSVEKAQPLAAKGAGLASIPREVAGVDVVMTMLADDAALRFVLEGPDGLLAGGRVPIHVSLSTISVALSERLTTLHADRGEAFLSAPVVGRPDAAAAGTMAVLCAGPADAAATCTPLFEAIGRRTFPLGAHPPDANLVKLCGNFMIMATIETLAEAMTLAEQGGIDRAALLEVLTGTLFDSPVHRGYGQILVEDRFRPAGFAAPLGLKDLRLVAQAADAQRTPLPLLGLLHDHLLSTIAIDGEDIDWSAMALAVRRAAGGERGNG